MTALAVAIGFLAGSLPTAVWVGRAAGHDLRRDGTGNPGTANAIGLGGLRLGLAVLAADYAKGVLAVVAGWLLAGEAAGLAAGVAAVAGQVVSPWYGFRGGKGLGVTGGAVLAAWPGAYVPLAPFLLVTGRLLGSSARGVLATLAVVVPVAALWAATDLPVLWGAEPAGRLVWFAAGLVAVVAPKFLRDAARERAIKLAGDGNAHRLE